MTSNILSGIMSKYIDHIKGGEGGGERGDDVHMCAKYTLIIYGGESLSASFSESTFYFMIAQLSSDSTISGHIIENVFQS